MAEETLCQRGRNFRLIFASVETIKLQPREGDTHVGMQAGRQAGRQADWQKLIVDDDQQDATIFGLFIYS
jgi:hypothetical protein